MVLKKLFGHKTYTLVIQDQTALDTMDLVIEVSLGEEGGGGTFFMQENYSSNPVSAWYKTKQSWESNLLVDIVLQ